MENYYPHVELEKVGKDYRLYPLDEPSLAMICVLSAADRDGINLAKDVTQEEMSSVLEDLIPSEMRYWLDDVDFLDSLLQLSLESGQYYWGNSFLYELELDALNIVSNYEGLFCGDHDSLISMYDFSLGLTDPPYLLWAEDDNESVGKVEQGLLQLGEYLKIMSFPVTILKMQIECLIS